ncbi:MAG: DNA gyrase inhibitor YacG [Desulfuromonadales bacterium]|nr:DNA gyrase inhibitor YacG [Desulfuromonadales bacterium]
MKSKTTRIVKCPTCHKMSKWEDNPFRPFCSERCKLIDLGNWADEEYRVPSTSLPTAADEDTDDEF